MIGIVVENNVVVIPVPVIAVADISRGDAEVVPTEPEASRTTPFKPPHMTASNPNRKMAVLPGMVEVKAGITASGVMPNPVIVGMNVRSLGMAWLVAEGTCFGLTRFGLMRFRLARLGGMIFGFW
jgi:hypothetical protein